MSKPLADDQDVPPEPSPLDDDLPPAPSEPSLRSRSRSQVKAPVPLGEEPDAAPPGALAEELLGSADQAAAPSVTAEGDVLTVGGARYRITRRLGAGGMGEVFLASKLGTGGFERDVALKTVLPVLTGHKKASTFLKGFVDEARLAALLHHPNICQVYDLQPLEGRGLIQVLEFIPGHSLKAIVDAARRKRASLTEPFACFVAGELAAALDYAHTATDGTGRTLGIVHRDVTPHNVMVSASGNVKLLDFGIAFSALENREATTSNMVKGKDQYYAPEQLVGAPLDGRTDQFALALCLYEMLTLKRFFTKTSTDTETALHLRIAQLTPESVEGVLAAAPIDPSLKKLLHHALAPSRDERFPTCADFGDALQSFSQRRGWLYKASDARKELEALFALEDSPDADKTNPSGKRVYSVAPRRVAKSTVQLPPLTPGRTAMTPPSPPEEGSRSKSAVPPGSTPEPVRQLTKQFFDSEPPPPEDSDPEQQQLEHSSRSASLKTPSETAMRRRAQLQEDLHNPKTSAKKMLALPAGILAATLLVGVVAVKLLVLNSPSSDTPTVEVVKTPEQLRAEREAEERAVAPAVTAAPELAPAPVAAPSEPVAFPTAQPPSTVPGAPRPTTTKRGAGKDAKAVDTLLSQQYGGRPVVTPEAPNGGIAGAPVPGAPVRRRTLDTDLSVDFAPSSASATSALQLPKGTTMAARLTSPADSAQASPATATITADVVVGGAVVVPKGSTLVCMTAPAGARLGLHCDTLNVGRSAVSIDAIALGSDKRVGFPLPRSSSSSDTGAGDIAKDNALNVGRSLLGRVAPEGAAGDVTNGAADTASSLARGGRGGSASDAPAALVPAGTAFTLFIQNPTN